MIDKSSLVKDQISQTKRERHTKLELLRAMLFYVGFEEAFFARLIRTKQSTTVLKDHSYMALREYQFAASRLNLGHLTYSFHYSFRGFTRWMMEAIPNVLEELLLSSLAQMMLLNLVLFLQFCEGSLHLLRSALATQQVVWNMSIIPGQNFTTPVKAVPQIENDTRTTRQ